MVVGCPDTYVVSQAFFPLTIAARGSPKDRPDNRRPTRGALDFPNLAFWKVHELDGDLGEGRTIP